MTYDLYLGDYSYSSWSLRGWLLFEKFGLPSRKHMVDFRNRDVAEQLRDIAPARTVPSLCTPEGAVIWDSLAMAEELATRHPGAGMWPDDPAARATARALVSEMHAGFTNLRNLCPMNLRTAYDWPEPPGEIRADLDRLGTIWGHARTLSQSDGPWLCGRYSIADAFFAPVAARIAGFSLPADADMMAYVSAHLNDPAFRRWRAMGQAQGHVLSWYEQDLPQQPWPGPVPILARPTERCDSENDACPYSGEPVTDFLEIEGRVFGFCNPFCRDKTAADPEAWPSFMVLMQAR